MPTRTKRPVTMSADAESTLQAPSSPLEASPGPTGDIDDPPVPEGTTEALEAFVATPEDTFMGRGQDSASHPGRALPWRMGFVSMCRRS